MRLKEFLSKEGFKHVTEAPVAGSAKVTLHVRTAPLGQGDRFYIVVTADEALEIRKAMREGQRTRQFPERVREIVNRHEKLRPIASVDLSDDRWGWYDNPNP